MKKQIAFILLIFLCVFNPNVYSQQQVPPDWIRQYEGIPIKTGLHWDWVLYNQEDVDSMINSGVDILHTHIGVKDDTLIDIGQQMSAIADLNLNVIAVKSRTGSNVLNWIQHYTDAKYSVWEAEGNPNHDANLEYKANVMDEITSGDTLKYLKLNPSAAGLQDTALICGPYYSQEVKYLTSQDGILDLVRYTAEYRLKLEINPQYPPIEVDPEDTICVIQVTQSSVGTGPWRLTCTDTIKQRVLKRGDFAQLNQFYNFLLHPVPDSAYYTLETNYCDSAVIGPQHHTFHSRFETTDDFIGRWHRNYIEFKVIWKGNSHYLLSIDKVTLSDQRGRELLGIVPSNAIANITAQANSLNSYNADELITGWLGIDEPVSIDIFEPIRIVTEILDNTSQRKRPLWITMMGRWDGRWNQRADPFGAMGLSPWTEMKKRVGRVNIIQNAYMFDAPCSLDSPPEYTACWTGEDYRSINIWRTGELMYKQAYELDPYFGVSIQTGEVHNTVAPAEQRDIRRHEFLYTAHLALLYGAKFLDLAPYFAQTHEEDCNSGYNCHAIIDFKPDLTRIYTDKYTALKDTLSPRLKGLFGKTIKHLVPASLKFLGKDILVNPDYSSFYSYIDYIEATGGQADTCVVDLGLFTDPADNLAKHFMIINRYYSTVSNMTIGLKELSDYKNWQITDLMDTSGLSLVAQNNRVEFDDTIIRGDAKFYNVLPVIRAGGILATDDTVFTSTTLTDNMTINDSVTLTVNSNYIIKDTVTLTGSGFIDGSGYLDLQSNGKIIISNWDRSLFKGRSGNHPKLIWAEHPTIGNVEQYKIYRKKETPGFNLIKTISDTLAKEFIDTTVIILDNPHSNETAAEYYIKAVYFEEESYAETNPSNTINYQRVQGSGLDKMGTGEMVQNLEYKLEQNYPNPFNPSTVIKYSIKESGMVELEILNILGERVKTLVNDIQPEGSYEIEFNAASLASGIYLYRIKVNDFVSAKKMILVK